MAVVSLNDSSPGRAAITRLDGIDAARGTAMLFVCLSHFGLEYFRATGQFGLMDLTTRVGMLASPTFVLVSGLMFGLLARARPDRIDALRRTLADRGLFMLLVGHLLIAVAFAPREGSYVAALRRGYMTDTIAVAILVGPALALRMSSRARVLTAVAALVLTWAGAITWTPTGLLERVIRHVLVGPYPEPVPNIFPLLAWVALYLFGTVLGESLVKARRVSRRAARRLTMGAAVAVVSVVVLKVALRVAAGGPLPLVGGWGIVYELTTPWRKLPPSPAYFAFYGGIGLLLTMGLMRLARLGLADWWIGSAALLGRASLAVFIAQFYVYYLVLHWQPLPATPLWPLLFLLTLLPIFAFAWLWDSYGGNRWLTVGLRGPSRLGSARAA